MIEKNIRRIEKIANELLNAELDYSKLKNVLEDYQSLLVELTQLEMSTDENRADIQFNNGIAIGTTWAALCISDVMRTRQFIRGIFKAVEAVHCREQGPVRILYAGSGPFASLILPLIAHYNYEQLQITVLETNSKSILYLKQLIQNLEIEKYFENILYEDATKFKLEPNSKFQILISETMQHGLVKEQQVPIMLNLVEQMEPDTIVIPEQVLLELGMFNTSSELILEGREEEQFKWLATLWEFDRKYISWYNDQDVAIKKNQEIQLLENIAIAPGASKRYDNLVVQTSIHVYGDEWIKAGESSLTIPKVLSSLHTLEDKNLELGVKYVMRGNPKFELTF